MTSLLGAPRVVCVVQARTGSTRLPGKVLQELDGVTMLEFMLRRLTSLHVDHLVVATSVLERDDAVVDIANTCHVAVVRGSETDVLDRFRTALDEYPSDHVIRLTADCPLSDPRMIEAVVAHHIATNADYTSNVLPRSFPKGLDVEVCRSSALRVAATEAVDHAEREHVTPFLYRRPARFRLANWSSARDLGDERWTVDTPDDMQFVREIVARVDNRHATWEQMLAVVGRAALTPNGDDVVLRSATFDDVQLLLELRNDPDAVRWSTSGLPVSKADHGRWCQAVLDNPAHRIRIAQRGGEPIGFVRVDVHDGIGTVSIAVDRLHRGNGYAALMLKAIVRDCNADCQVRELTAAIHLDNLASVRAFAAAGFVASTAADAYGAPTPFQAFRRAA